MPAAEADDDASKTLKGSVLVKGLTRSWPGKVGTWTAVQGWHSLQLLWQLGGIEPSLVFSSKNKPYKHLHYFLKRHAERDRERERAVEGLIYPGEIWRSLLVQAWSWREKSEKRNYYSSCTDEIRIKWTHGHGSISSS